MLMSSRGSTPVPDGFGLRLPALYDKDRLAALLARRPILGPGEIKAPEAVQWLLGPAGFADGQAVDTLGDETRTQQPGRGYLFDGVDDLVTIPDHADIQDVWDGGGRVKVYAKSSSAGGTNNGRIYQKGATAIMLESPLGGANKLKFRVTYTGGDRAWETSDRVIADTTLHEIDVSFNADTDTSDPIITVGGVAVPLTQTGVGTGTRVSDVGTDLTFGNHPGGAYGWHGLLSGFEMYNQGTRKLRLLCDESVGATSYDSSGNGHHGAITNATMTTFHATDSDIPTSVQNDVGHSDGGGGVLIPRDESDPIKDVLGNPLDHPGRVRYHGDLVQSHCAAFDGVDDKITFADIPAGAVIRSSQGTAVPTIDPVNDEITFTAGSCWDLVIEDSGGEVWAWLPLQEGGGTTGYDVSGNANHGTLANITAGSFWGSTQDGTDNDSHWNLTRGFRDSEGVKIPARVNGSAAADGNPITNPAGRGMNGAETGLRMTVVVPALKDSWWYESGSPATRYFADIAADYSDAHQTLADVRSAARRNLCTFSGALSGPALEATRRFLRH